MSNMETVVHVYLTKLRIISKVPLNGRLDITNNELDIYKDSFIGWVLRKWGSDCKDNATKYLYDLYREINSFSSQIMDNINFETSETRKVFLIMMLVSLTEKIKESLVGIRNLIGTYKDWLKTSSNLECLEQDIIIPQFRILKNFIPEKFHTDILKSSISYSHVYKSGVISGRPQRSMSMLEPVKGEPSMDTLSPLVSSQLNTVLQKSDPIDIPRTDPPENESYSAPTISHKKGKKKNIDTY